MRKLNLRNILIFVMIFLLILLMFLTTYSYLNKKYIKKSSNNSFDKALKIDYSDTSSISLVNPKENKTINKSIKIKNTLNNTLYYDIVLDNVVNNFSNTDKLECSVMENEKSIRDNIYLTKDKRFYILSNIKINPGEEKQLQIEIKYTNLSKNNDLGNKTFSASIKVEQSKGTKIGQSFYGSDELGYKIINNMANENVTNGVYETNNTINGYTSYYYKGNADLNNNVMFADICFKIIRTTENGGIKMIYNGKALNNECNGILPVINQNTKFNNKSSFNANIGYVYGNANSSSYQLEHENKNSSNIKDIVDKWYLDNINKYSDFVDDALYCQDRNTETFNYKSTIYGTLGYGSKNTGYSSMYRNITNKSKTLNPTYDCKNVNDRLSKNIDNSSKVLTYPVALITIDELIYAGLFDGKYNKNNYLSTKESYWTMTPAYYNASGAYNFYVKNDEIKDQLVSSISGVRPVITLKRNTKVLSGDGSANNPYKIN